MKEEKLTMQILLMLDMDQGHNVGIDFLTLKGQILTGLRNL